MATGTELKTHLSRDAEFPISFRTIRLCVCMCMNAYVYAEQKTSYENMRHFYGGKE